MPTGKSQRTLRSRTDRLLLWEAAGGKCEICGKPIEFEEMECDHVIPWRVSQRTSVFEMQALCANCNRKKGGEVHVDDAAGVHGNGDVWLGRPDQEDATGSA